MCGGEVGRTIVVMKMNGESWRNYLILWDGCNGDEEGSDLRVVKMLFMM